MDAHDLRRRFHASIDHRYIKNLLANLHHSNPPFPLRALGAGAHFEAYSLENNGLRLVVKRAREGFLSNLPGLRRAWIAAMRSIQNSPIPMVPPFELFEEVDTLAYVMPFGENLDRPLPALEVEGLVEALASRGLEITDYPQFRWIEANPYIVDWSDLKKSS